MSLIKCPECEKEISSKAKTCPHCGCPLESKEPKKEPKKRFSSKEYKMTGFICSIACSLLFLIFLLGLTFNNIISIPIAFLYGIIIYLLSKYLLNTKVHIKKYLWLVMLFIMIPVLITFVLLTQNEIWEYSNDSATYRIETNLIGGCNYYLKTNDEERKSIKCNYHKEGNNYSISVTTNKNKKIGLTCDKNNNHFKCPYYDDMYEAIIPLEKK